MAILKLDRWNIAIGDGEPLVVMAGLNVLEDEGLAMETCRHLQGVCADLGLPYVFKAVQIGADHYWDGGFMGNPAIFPLIYKGASNDVVVVHVNPLSRDLLPRTAAEIADRVNEITFNSSLMREMRAIAFVSRLVSEQSVDSGRYSRMHVHAIRNEVEMRRLSPESKLEPDWNFLTRLRDIGRDTASQWLEDTFEHIGKSTTIDLADMYL